MGIITGNFEYNLVGRLTSTTSVRTLLRNVGSSLSLSYQNFSTPIQLGVNSTSANDVYLGANGAWSVLITGIVFRNGTHQFYDEVVNLNGTANVLTVATDWVRVFNARIFQASAGQNTAIANSTPQGTVSVKNAANTLTFIGIQPFYGSSQAALFTTASGRQAILKTLHIATNTTQPTLYELRMRTFTNVSPNSYNESFQCVWQGMTGNSAGVSAELNLNIPPLTDIEVSVQSLGGASTLSMLSANIEVY